MLVSRWCEFSFGSSSIPRSYLACCQIFTSIVLNKDLEKVGISFFVNVDDRFVNDNYRTKTNEPYIS